MIRREGRWIDVQPNDYVEDKNGEMWRVTRWDHIEAGLLGKDGRTGKVRPDPYQPVILYRPTVKDAVSVVQRIIGGEIIYDSKGTQQ